MPQSDAHPVKFAYRQCLRITEPVEALFGLAFYPATDPPSSADNDPGSGVVPDHAAPAPAMKRARSVMEEDSSAPGDAPFLSKASAPSSMFAVVGGHKVMIFRTQPLGPMELLVSYQDETPNECFYRCAWTHLSCPILAFTGFTGQIHLLRLDSPSHPTLSRLVGHGDYVSELVFHPTRPNLLFSASKDHTARLWDIVTGRCLVVFGGDNGHTDQVLSLDVHASGDWLATSGMDHDVKVWRLDEPAISARIESPGALPVLTVHCPVFSNRKIHTNYVDCVRWVGDALLTKALSARLVLWRRLVDLSLAKPIRLQDQLQCPIRVLASAPYEDGFLWFLPATLSLDGVFLATGSASGRAWIWDLREWVDNSAEFYKRSIPQRDLDVLQRRLARKQKEQEDAKLATVGGGQRNDSTGTMIQQPAGPSPFANGSQQHKGTFSGSGPVINLISSSSIGSSSMGSSPSLSNSLQSLTVQSPTGLRPSALVSSHHSPSVALVIEDDEPEGPAPVQSASAVAEAAQASSTSKRPIRIKPPERVERVQPPPPPPKPEPEREPSPPTLKPLPAPPLSHYGLDLTEDSELTRAIGPLFEDEDELPLLPDTLYKGDVTITPRLVAMLSRKEIRMPVRNIGFSPDLSSLIMIFDDGYIIKYDMLMPKASSPISDEDS